MRILKFLALMFVLGVVQREAHAQWTMYQSSLQVGGTTNRYAVAATNFNGEYYVAYTNQNGLIYVAPSSSLTTFTSSTAVTTPAGNITSSGSPALTVLSGQLYMSYIVGNNTLYVTHSADGSSWSTPTIVSVPSGVVPDATPSLAADTLNGALIIGFHDHTKQAIVICTLNVSTLSSTCSQPTGAGSTYGPGLLVSGSTLYTFFESSNSKHSLYYFVTNINPDGSLPQFILDTDASGDQTSGQPSATLPNGDFLVVGFRSNDSSAHFLTKSYNWITGVWSNSVDSGVSMNGAPSLLSSGTTVMNFYAPNSSPYDLNVMYSTTE
jgi:hypothetical protein